jgi:L-rhamnonate dehydratase
MDVSIIEAGWRIDKIEWTVMPGIRARSAGSDARIGVHGTDVPLQLARITIAGEVGYGWSRITKETADALIGTNVRVIFNEQGVIRNTYRSIEFPLLDWFGTINNKPLHTLIARNSDSVIRIP